MPDCTAREAVLAARRQELAEAGVAATLGPVGGRPAALARLGPLQEAVDAARRDLDTCLGCPDPVRTAFVGVVVVATSLPEMRFGDGFLAEAEIASPGREVRFEFAGCRPGHEVIRSVHPDPAFVSLFSAFTMTVPRQPFNIFSPQFPFLSTAPHRVPVSPLTTFLPHLGAYERQTGHLDIDMQFTVRWADVGEPAGFGQNLGIDRSPSAAPFRLSTRALPDPSPFPVIPVPGAPSLYPPLQGEPEPLDRSTGELCLVGHGTLSGGLGHGVTFTVHMSGRLTTPLPVGP